MSTNHTPNYNLCQWEAGDKVVRTDFNEDNAKIDAALKAQSEAVESVSAALSSLTTSAPNIAAGYYNGDGTKTRLISVGFTPKAVLVLPLDGALYFNFGSSLALYGGLAVTGAPAKLGSLEAVTIKTGGFQVSSRDSSACYTHTNDSDRSYHYLAVG